FFQQRGVSNALLILVFMLLYKLGDSMATALQTPFFQDLGFSGTEIGVIAKNISLWAVIIGGIFGGVWMIRLGINRSLWIFGGVQIVSILGFALLAQVGADRLVLAVVMFFEYLGVGLGTAAFIAFIYRSTSVQHAATQIALLTALTALPRTLANASTGLIVESVGWELFFYICTLLAVPGMLLLFKVAPWNGDKKADT
ncbi:MAG: MFS transporter, partial [Porticoccaceae bacterium]|nr:MFS transporter [Porticoccaceae bacterium]